MANSLQIRNSQDAANAAYALQEFFLGRSDLSRRIDPAFLHDTYRLLLELLPALNAETEFTLRPVFDNEKGGSLKQGVLSSMQQVVEPMSTYAVLGQTLGCIATLIMDGKGVSAGQLARTQILLDPLWQFRNLFTVNR